jgi:hypothetical protein
MSLKVTEDLRNLGSLSKGTEDSAVTALSNLASGVNLPSSNILGGEVTLREESEGLFSGLGATSLKSSRGFRFANEEGRESILKVAIRAFTKSSDTISLGVRMASVTCTLRRAASATLVA